MRFDHRLLKLIPMGDGIFLTEGFPTLFHSEPGEQISPHYFPPFPPFTCKEIGDFSLLFPLFSRGLNRGKRSREPLGSPLYSIFNSLISSSHPFSVRFFFIFTKRSVCRQGITSSSSTQIYQSAPHKSPTTNVEWPCTARPRHF